MYHENHYIFKLFDGKNFFDVNNFKENISKKANNYYATDGKNYQISLAVYYCTI
jgi:hypothetical protein